jgi:Na+/proline symporter
MDTLLNGIASAVTSDLAAMRDKVSSSTLLRSSRGITVVLVLPAILIASQGYSVLYMFLIADMVCAAVVFPVFWGLYSREFDGRAAAVSSVIGLTAGVLFFPTPEAPYLSGWLLDIEWATQLLASFAFALGASTAASLVMSVLPRRRSYDFARLAQQVKLIAD